MRRARPPRSLRKTFEGCESEVGGLQGGHCMGLAFRYTICLSVYVEGHV